MRANANDSLRWVLIRLESKNKSSHLFYVGRAGQMRRRRSTGSTGKRANDKLGLLDLLTGCTGRRRISRLVAAAWSRSLGEL